MVDNLTPNTPMQPADPGAAEKKPSFLSTPNGRIVMIVGAVFAFLAIAGIAAAVVFTFFIKGAVEDVVTDVANQVASGSTTATASAEATEGPAVEPGDVPLSDLFTFRDIFDPLVKPAVVSDEESETADFTGAADTLYLLDIIVEDGLTKAVLSYNGTEYKAAEGQVLGTTPWQVLDIGSSSAVMLFGDTQVTLSVGQGVTDNTSATTDTTSK